MAQVQAFQDVEYNFVDYRPRSDDEQNRKVSHEAMRGAKFSELPSAASVVTGNQPRRWET
jgi:hypothetical protein